MDKNEKPLIKSYLQECLPLSFKDGVLSLETDEEFETAHIEILTADEHFLENCLHRITGRTVKIAFIMKKEVLSPHETIAMHPGDVETMKKKALDNQFVRQVAAMFDGKIIDVWGQIQKRR